MIALSRRIDSYLLPFGLQFMPLILLQTWSILYANDNFAFLSAKPMTPYTHNLEAAA